MNESNNTIYIVEGRTGAYDTYKEWQVCVYIDPILAKEHAQKAQLRSNEWHNTYEAPPDGWNIYDPNMPSPDYQIEYYTYPLPVRITIPE